MTGRPVKAESISNPVDRLLRSRGILLSDLSYKFKKYMSISELLIKLIGIILAVVGLGLLLSTVGLGFMGIGISPAWLSLLLGVIFLGAGIYIIRGGNITL